jgi:NDP-sugar pyrophosphorylase family protein
MESVTVAAGATVRDSVLLPGASIGSSAVVLDSIVGWSARVGEGARLESMCVLGEEAVVAAGEELSGELRARR